MSPDNIFDIPDDKEISSASARLGMIFHPDYILFIKSGYDLGDSILQPLLIHPNAGHLNIFQALTDARRYYDLPKELLPIVEDNSDYYCLTQQGEILFWSHNGTTDERWSSIAAWRNQMIAESQE